MAVHDDLTINSSKFGPAAIPPEANVFNENLMTLMAQFPKWFEARQSIAKCV
ncbi:hypothetical protein LPUS_07798 [Lasallia pustulata]|uniref:Uncharacterized protein n=1 Tax=Lasallia pustulata TaxID=136370 RepID=A0A1W5D441_9LECA|nr:hypothetical protein LPUS_07798 [Lasallia pustulata]